MSPVVAKPVAKPAGPAPRKAKKASALKGKKGKRSGTMPGQAVAGSTAGAEEEEEASPDDKEERPRDDFDDVLDICNNELNDVKWSVLQKELGKCNDDVQPGQPVSTCCFA